MDRTLAATDSAFIILSVRLLPLCCTFLLLSSIIWSQSVVEQPHTTASLFVSHQSVEPGSSVHLVLRLEHHEGWHSYWKNPGDSGMPVMVSGLTSDRFKHDGLQFPIPEPIPTPPLLSYGYSEEARFLIHAQVPTEGKTDPLLLRPRFDWLVCEEVCIPESAQFEVELSIGENRLDTQAQSELKMALRAMPSESILRSSFAVRNGGLEFYIPESVPKGHLYFFPKTEGLWPAAASQTVLFNPRRLRVEAVAQPKHRLQGLLKTSTGGYPVQFNHQPSHSASKSNASSDLGLGLALLMAFAGGVLLNLMPCVLPVLSLKAISLAGASHKERRESRNDSLFYTAGILVSFLILAGLLALFKLQGEMAGWGFQLQSPWFVAALGWLFFVVGLNLSGFFELPALMTGSMGRVSRLGQFAEPFFTGVLATFVATPCTGPFMAVAIGWALSEPFWVVLLVFEFLGLGLAFPYLLFGFSASARTLLPRPGPWMQTFRNMLAWPMFLASLWLIFVLGQQTGLRQATALLLLFILSAFTLQRYRGLKSLRTQFALLTFLLIGSVSFIRTFVDAPNEQQETFFVPFDPHQIQNHLDAGRPVFVDATADWCITCKVNENVVLSRKDVRRAMREADVVPMVADWTKRDETIRSWLESFGRQGVPLYVYYWPDQEPEVWPQILTPGLVLDRIQNSPKEE